jgi:hypothetical protein
VTISTNGYVCLGSNTGCGATGRPSPFDIIVGLNADLNTARSGSGQIYYQTLSSISSFFTQAKSQVNLLDSSFVPTNIFMITYDRVLAYDATKTSLVSFQIFLTTGSTKSFVTLKYTSCPTDYSASTMSGLTCNIYGGFDQWTSISATSWCTSSNVGSAGVWVFDLAMGKNLILKKR